MWLMLRTSPGGAGGAPGLCPLPCDPLAGTDVPGVAMVVPIAVPAVTVAVVPVPTAAPVLVVVVGLVTRLSPAVNWPLTEARVSDRSVPMVYVTVTPLVVPVMRFDGLDDAENDAGRARRLSWVLAPTESSRSVWTPASRLIVPLSTRSKSFRWTWASGLAPTPLRSCSVILASRKLRRGARPVPPETWPTIAVSALVPLYRRFSAPSGSTVVPARVPTPNSRIVTCDPCGVV